MLVSILCRFRQITALHQFVPEQTGITYTTETECRLYLDHLSGGIITAGTGTKTITVNGTQQALNHRVNYNEFKWIVLL